MVAGEEGHPASLEGRLPAGSNPLMELEVQTGGTILFPSARMTFQTGSPVHPRNCEHFHLLGEKATGLGVARREDRRLQEEQ